MTTNNNNLELRLVLDGFVDIDRGGFVQSPPPPPPLTSFLGWMVLGLVKANKLYLYYGKEISSNNNCIIHYSLTQLICISVGSVGVI